MALPSWLIREDDCNERHVHCSLFVGPDADHRAKSGSLVFDPEQFEDFTRLLAGDTNRVQVDRRPQQPDLSLRTSIDALELCIGWEHDPDDPVRVIRRGGSLHLLGRPIPDHVPFDGEIICTLPESPHERIDPVRFHFEKAGDEGAGVEWTYYSIETDGSVRWRPRPEGV